METLGFPRAINWVKAGWQHASESEQNARAPRFNARKAGMENTKRNGSASMLLAQASVLPACFRKRAGIARQRSRETSGVQRFVISISLLIRHSSFHLRHFR